VFIKHAKKLLLREASFLVNSSFVVFPLIIRYTWKTHKAITMRNRRTQIRPSIDMIILATIVFRITVALFLISSAANIMTLTMMNNPLRVMQQRKAKKYL
jgi:hypothetical protein